MKLKTPKKRKHSGNHNSMSKTIERLSKPYIDLENYNIKTLTKSEKRKRKNLEKYSNKFLIRIILTSKSNDSDAEERESVKEANINLITSKPIKPSKSSEGLYKHKKRRKFERIKDTNSSNSSKKKTHFFLNNIILTDSEKEDRKYLNKKNCKEDEKNYIYNNNKYNDNVNNYFYDSKNHNDDKKVIFENNINKIDNNKIKDSKINENNVLDINSINYNKDVDKIFNEIKHIKSSN
jgi:hypothetical protein